jgi:glutaredoxin
MSTPTLRTLFPTTVLLLAAGTASAQYKYVGPDGRVTYSDVPPPPTAKVLEQKKLASAAPGPALPFALQQAVTKYPVTLYTGDKCAPCDSARTFLRDRGVPFAEKTVTSDDDIAAFKRLSPDGTAPVVMVGSRKTVGFSQAALASLLDSAGYPATSTLPRDFQNVEPTPLSPNTRAPTESVVAQTPAPPAPKRGETPPVPAPANPSGFRF